MTINRAWEVLVDSAKFDDVVVETAIETVVKAGNCRECAEIGIESRVRNGVCDTCEDSYLHDDEDCEQYMAERC